MMSDQSTSFISVIVCTFNRSELLRRALETLHSQSCSPSDYEIIVIDNNSRDKTKQVVEEMQLSCRNLIYAKETKQGLSNARNAGLKIAKGSYVAYTDDDCEIPADWLKTASQIIQTHRPSVFGGPYLALYKQSKPKWFKDEYGSRSFGNEARVLPKEYLSGNNIFFDRRLLELCGGFDSELGMTGYHVAYGEEVAVQKKIRKKFPDRSIYYDPALFVYHLVRLEKMTLPWLLRAFFSKGRYVYWASYRNQSKTTLPVLLYQAWKAAFAFMADATLGTIFRNRSRYPFAYNYFYEHSSSFLRTLGRVYAQYLERKDRSGAQPDASILSDLN